ncbi:hypothetical protein FNV43_RR06110 [Rhamnella rubrinervis]|uniref:Ribosomal RNA methyltransferase SPB1-like C-terminal domain-containing protein n=1 Tax=Rhamnella rubrinervis TaxID=2594499 RepID=A0A8K0HCF7_9ROSA|nr:hypothetical protein FNV43_RR06110 [Rhamnella rubrinervis]
MQSFQFGVALDAEYILLSYIRSSGHRTMILSNILFEKVVVHKPRDSCSASAETYIMVFSTWPLQRWICAFLTLSIYFKDLLSLQGRWWMYLEEQSKKDTEMGKKKKFPLPEKAKERAANHVVRSNQLQRHTSMAQDDFEIVPAVATDSTDSSSDELEDEDVDSKVEICKERGRKEASPANQACDQRRDCCCESTIKEIDAQPAKVAEAEARKKRAAMRQLEKVCKTANIISDQTDISEQSKWNQIEQLYKKAVPKRPSKEFVVAEMGVNVRVGKGKVLVDRRMKKDARSRKTEDENGRDQGIRKRQNDYVRVGVDLTPTDALHCLPYSNLS